MKTEFRHAGAILSIVLLVVSGCRSIGSAPEPAGIATAGQDVTAQLSLARLSERHGDPDYAAQMYRVILSENPNNPTAHHRLAVIAAQQQRLDDADRHFERAMAAADPTAAERASNFAPPSWPAPATHRHASHTQPVIESMVGKGGGGVGSGAAGGHWLMRRGER